MPRIEVLREKVLASRRRMKQLHRELGAVMRAEYRDTQALKAALEKRRAQIVDREWRVRREPGEPR